MKRSAFLVLLGSVVLAASGAAAAERAATKVEIEKKAVGKTFRAGMKYHANGRYTFQGGSPGRYKISNGQICVRFDAGGSRCDKILVDGAKFTMVNSSGKRFAFE